MKLLLTSFGLANATIVAALERLMGKPIGEASVMYVPTALHATPGGAGYAWEMLGTARPADWRSVGFLELTALPGIAADRWLPQLEAADVIMVGGGNTPYLSYWLQRSGFAAMLPGLLRGAVYAGISAGSMVVGSNFWINRVRLARDGVYDDDLYGDVAPAGQGSDATPGLVDFALRPHLGSPDFPGATVEGIARIAEGPTYAIDDASAVVVDSDDVTVASEGTWHYLP
ncbi:MAG TPA: Type 1 glutamine amidotransferase-like domain-containing protein [Actinoplanes sp.]|nr:Type 1 glutamine amidotransferase-like domain-containing protein [Actinoplanes sp.]